MDELNLHHTFEDVRNVFIHYIKNEDMAAFCNELSALITSKKHMILLWKSTKLNSENLENLMFNI